MTTQDRPLTPVGRAGHVAGHDVLITPDDRIVVFTDPAKARTHHVPNYGTSLWELAHRPGFRLGWARMPDDAEILYFYDRDDDSFGYALNLDCDWCSEWGYAPFAGEHEDACDQCGGPLDDDAIMDDAMQAVCGGCVETSQERAREAILAEMATQHRQAVAERDALATSAASVQDMPRASAERLAA